MLSGIKLSSVSRSSDQNRNMKVPPETGSGINGRESSPQKEENDFSEYMWMENEEEFDKEVMRQLEEEALMEQCIQAMLEDEEKDAADSFHELTEDLKNLNVLDKPDLVKKSTLNPNAAEFVPRASFSIIPN